jgi:hypothetical protein
VLAESSRIAAPMPGAATPDELPRLQRGTVEDLMADSSVPKTYITGETTLQDTDLEGLIIVENSAALFLENVVIKGLVVSEDVLEDAPLGEYDPSTVPCLVINGNVRIEPGDFLPDASVVMPDGMVTTWTDEARLQIDGDIVAHTVKLNRPGSVMGHIACVDPLELHAELERPGEGRRPEPWSDALDMGGAFQDEYLAFLPRNTTIGELAPVVGYWNAGTQSSVVR